MKIVLCLITFISLAHSFPDPRAELLDIKTRVKNLKQKTKNSTGHFQKLQTERLDAFERNFSSLEDLPNLDKEELEKLEVALEQYENAQAEADKFLRGSTK